MKEILLTQYLLSNTFFPMLVAVAAAMLMAQTFDGRRVRSVPAYT